jgi:hypothetical protein
MIKLLLINKLLVIIETNEEPSLQGGDWVAFEL